MWGAKEFTRGTKKIFARFVRRTTRTERLCSTQLELKTEKGYVLEIYVRTMSALCPHNISLVRHISFVRCCTDIVRTYYISRDIYVRTMSALYPFSVFSSGNMRLYVVPLEGRSLAQKLWHSSQHFQRFGQV